MKIETDENTSIAITVCVIVIAIAIVCAHRRHQVESTKRAAFKAGLVQVQLDGTTKTRFANEPSR